VTSQADIVMIPGRSARGVNDEAESRVEEVSPMAKKSRGGRMTAAKNRAAKRKGGKGLVKNRRAGKRIMKT
jgi:hypothetical protein